MHAAGIFINTEIINIECQDITHISGMGRLQQGAEYIALHLILFITRHKYRRLIIPKFYNQFFTGIFCRIRNEDIRSDFRMDCKYLFKQRSDGTYTNEPIDFFNHTIDALRYACGPYITTAAGSGIYHVK